MSKIRTIMQQFYMLLILSVLRFEITTTSKPKIDNGDDDPKNPVQALITKLFKNYNKEAVLEMPTIIHMDILLLKVRNTIEKEGIFESVIALMIEWTDKRMTWNPSEYANLTFLSLGTDQVWLPDIAMTNSADHLYEISRDSRFMVRVSYDGLFKFVPTGTARTWCDLKLLTFPFDIQQCSLEFESWSLDSTTMTFDGNSDLLVDSSFASTQFQLCEHRATTYYHTYNFTGETFTRLRFEFTVKRKSTFYVINLIFPCATLSFIQLLTFLIPSTASTVDRVGFGTTNLLTLVVFQTIVTEEMPKTSDAVTALSKYVICLICMAAVGILESVIVERFQERTINPPPDWLLNLFECVPVIFRELPADRRQHKEMINNKEQEMRKQEKENFRVYENEEIILGASLCCPYDTRSYEEQINSPSANNTLMRQLDINIEPENIRRSSYQLAMTEGKLNRNYKTAMNGLPFVQASSSMISFQPSVLSIPDIKINDETSSEYWGSENPEITATNGPSSNLSDTSPCYKPLNKIESNSNKQITLGQSVTQIGKPSKLFGSANLRAHTISCQNNNNNNNNKKKGSPKRVAPMFGEEFSSPTAFRNLRPADLWIELAFKMDSVTLLVCATVAVAAPMIMFLPLVAFEGEGKCAAER